MILTIVLFPLYVLALRARIKNLKRGFYLKRRDLIFGEITLIAILLIVITGITLISFKIV